MPKNQTLAPKRRPRVTTAPLNDDARRNLQMIKEMTHLRESELSKILLEHQLSPKAAIPPLLHHMVDVEELKTFIVEAFKSYVPAVVQEGFPDKALVIDFYVPKYESLEFDDCVVLKGHIVIQVVIDEQVVVSKQVDFKVDLLVKLNYDKRTPPGSYFDGEVEQVLWIMEHLPFEL